jgi:PKD repeat protein
VGESVNHLYANNGTYTATLTVTDGDGGVTTSSMTVTVNQPPTVSINDLTLVEGDDGITYATFTASLSDASIREVSVNYSTSDGTAEAGSDYEAAAGTITFAVGETSKTITVRVKGDRP